MGLIRNTKGQLTLYLAMVIVVCITILAFIVNIGLLVKAKINLQNAVDAAAWSGAAVQSRQLSNISYLNWEMRNTYKEWMFKYYILGQIGLDEATRSEATATGTNMDFRLHIMNYVGANFVPPDPKDADKFNVPSICINFKDASNICKISRVPGLPRFATVGLPAMDEMYNEAINAIVRKKAEDCSSRSNLNYAVARMWAYGTGRKESIANDAPQIADQRIGAWPQAFELALRIRNLEKIVNQPPTTVDITTVNTLTSPLPIHERTVKAFWAAYRNLGNSNDTELKDSLKLTELSPEVYTSDPGSLSHAFIEADASGADKIYLDLQPFLLNLVTFYTAFTSQQEQILKGTESQAACAATKIGLPVPAYPIGFMKNPAILTYYAVKGEADFNGLFNPFAGSIKLTAVSAAKPFGGRIGPMLFLNHLSHKTTTVLRQEGLGHRSGPYVSGLITNTTKAWAPGIPIPANEDFWIRKPGDTIGGSPEVVGIDIKFAIPNLFSRMIGEISNQHNFSVISSNAGPNAVEEAGLFDKKQYFSFKENLDIANGSGDALTQQVIEDAIILARRPTDYEALNYLIPTMHIDEPEIDTVSIVKRDPDPTSSPDLAYRYSLFAPLYGEDTFLPNIDGASALLMEFIEANRPSIEAYVRALHGVAKAILETSPGPPGPESSYFIAAHMIHDNPGNPLLPGCHSMAGQFWYFYTSQKPPASSPDPRDSMKSKPCPSFDQNLKSTLAALWKNADTDLGNPNFRTHYRQTYVNPGYGAKLLPSVKQLMSAYRPGTRSGADSEGLIRHPFIASTRPVSPWRNYYSTKFVSLKSLSGNGEGYDKESFSLYSETGAASPASLPSMKFSNPLKVDPTEDISKVEI